MNKFIVAAISISMLTGLGVVLSVLADYRQSPVKKPHGEEGEVGSISTSVILPRDEETRTPGFDPGLEEWFAKYSGLFVPPSYAADLVTAAHGKPELRWTEQQLQLAQQIYDLMQRRRLLHEGVVAEVVRRDGDEVVIEIPAYAERGAQLRQLFVAELRRQFGRVEADKLLAATGAELGQRMRSYGEMPQTIEVRFDRATREYHFHHTATVRDGQGGWIQQEQTRQLSSESLDVYSSFATLLPR